MFMQNSKRTAPIPRHGKAEPGPDYPLVCLAIDAVVAAYTAVSRWFDRRRNRQVLAALNNHQLRDIGLTRADISNWSGELSAVLGKPAGDIGCRARHDARHEHVGD